MRIELVSVTPTVVAVILGLSCAEAVSATDSDNTKKVHQAHLDKDRARLCFDAVRQILAPSGVHSHVTLAISRASAEDLWVDCFSGEVIYVANVNIRWVILDSLNLSPEKTITANSLGLKKSEYKLTDVAKTMRDIKEPTESGQVENDRVISARPLVVGLLFVVACIWLLSTLAKRADRIRRRANLRR
jgi:hypothetical protein